MNKASLVSFFLFCLVYLVVLYSWLSIDQTLPITDSANYFIQTLHGFNKLSTEGLHSFFHYMIVAGGLHSALFPALGSIVAFCVSTDPDTIIFIMNSLSLLLLFFSTLMLCRFFSSDITALCSLVLLGLYPSIFGLSRQYMLDLPSASVTMFSIYFLVQTFHKPKRTYSILLINGLIVGLAFSIKESSVFVFFPAMLFLLGFEKANFKEKSFSLLAICFVACIVSLPFYMNGFVVRVSEIWRHIMMGTEHLNQPDSFSFESLVFYARHFSIILSPVFQWLLGVSFVCAFFTRKMRGLALCFVTSYLLFSVIPSKASRYIVSLLPIAAILSVWFLFEFKKRYLFFFRGGFAFALLFYGVYQFYLLSYAKIPIFGQEMFLPKVQQVGWSFYTDHKYLDAFFGRQGWLDISRRQLGPLWSFDPIYKELEQGAREKPAVLMIIHDYPYLTGPLQIRLLRNQIPVSITSGAYSPLEASSADYIVSIPGWKSEERLKNNIKMANDIFRERSDCVEVASVSFPVVEKSALHRCGLD